MLTENDDFLDDNYNQLLEKYSNKLAELENYKIANIKANVALFNIREAILQAKAETKLDDYRQIGLLNKLLKVLNNSEG